MGYLGSLEAEFLRFLESGNFQCGAVLLRIQMCNVCPYLGDVLGGLDVAQVVAHELLKLLAL